MKKNSTTSVIREINFKSQESTNISWKSKIESLAKPSADLHMQKRIRFKIVLWRTFSHFS